MFNLVGCETKQTGASSSHNAPHEQMQEKGWCLEGMARRECRGESRGEAEDHTKAAPVGSRLAKAARTGS